MGLVNLDQRNGFSLRFASGLNAMWSLFQIPSQLDVTVATRKSQVGIVADQKHGTALTLRS
jgi:hypothetical protein